MAKRNFLDSNNPMMKEDLYRKNPNVLDAEMAFSGETMTVNGAVNKTLILFGVMMVTTIISYTFPNPLFYWGGLIGTIVFSFIANRNVEKSKTFAPIFSAILGLFVGSVSFSYASFMDGIIFQAVTITFSILFTMLMLYKSGLIKVTERFRSIIMMATGAIMLTYGISIVVSLFGGNLPFLHEYSTIGIGISLVIVVIASLKLLVDFDNFYKGEQYNAPEYMEWFFGMGLLFTLVWLYLEVLWLISALAGD